jgi:hypothetical protein
MFATRLPICVASPSTAGNRERESSDAHSCAPSGIGPESEEPPDSEIVGTSETTHWPGSDPVD